ncbi:MAG TPA: serine/threonine-protein kinase [Kofleriaceae bacterium]|nr:serine/threonine-protein kinase [Kofleriaceae bacterium]
MAVRDGDGDGSAPGLASGEGVTHPAASDSAPPSGDTTIEPLMRELARTPSVDIRARLATAGGQIARFVVDRTLGEGGMGVVVAAHDPTLDRKVAIKLLRSSTTSAAARTRLVREAQAAARVEHENIIAIHEVASADDHVFVVMELVDGDTLTKWQRGKPWREVLAAYLRAGRGLAAAHDANLVHRDFKPDNVLVGKDGRLRVTDFGLVAASGQLVVDSSDTSTPPTRKHDSEPPHALKTPLTRTGDVMGTPAYMAPEQYRGEPAGHAADQFSFCVALWEGLYGLRPFDAATLAERQERILRGELAGPLPDRNIPPRFEPLLRRGLDANPARRWPDMHALLAALADDPDARSQRRRRNVAIVGGVAIAAAGIAVTGVLLLGNARAPAAPPPCRGLERDLDGAWDPPRKDALTRAFAATGRPYAAEVTTRVTAALDERAAALTARRIESCEATSVRRTQSAELLDRTTACLDRRRGELAATVDVFLSDAAASMSRAVDAVLALPPLEACTADRVLAADTTPPPGDPASRDTIARIRVDVDRAAALGRAGRWKDALAPAVAAATAARTLAYAPLVAETVAVEARAKLVTGDTKGADAAYHEAIAAAATAKDAALGAQLTVALVEVANREARYSDVETLASLADATLGAPDERDERWAERATLAAERGRAARAQQKLDDARAHLERALQLRSDHAGPDSVLVAKTLSDLGNLELAAADWPKAEALFRRALAIIEKTSGPRHPDLANALGRLAVTAKEQHRLDEAAANLRRGIEILTAAEGADSPALATMWANLGVVLGEQDQGADALAAYEKALAVREKVLPPDHPDLASSIMNVGIALQENLARPADAVPYFERAKKILEKKLGPDHPTLAFALHGLGSARLDMGQPAAGVADLEHAYRIRSGPAVDPGLKADTGYMLAKALWGAGNRKRAEEIARVTRRSFVDLGYPADPWLDEHGK